MILEMFFKQNSINCSFYIYPIYIYIYRMYTSSYKRENDLIHNNLDLFVQ